MSNSTGMIAFYKAGQFIGSKEFEMPSGSSFEKLEFFLRESLFCSEEGIRAVLQFEDKEITV